MGCKTVLNDTWTWDGVSWKLETPPTSPSPRSQASMAYDPVLAKVILFGGAFFGDMYAWDGQTWTELHPQTLPAARYGAGMAYSVRDPGLVLFGGIGLTGYLPETWIWNGVTWTQVKPAVGPSVVSPLAGMAYDAALDSTVLIVAGEVWTWGGQ